MEKSFGLFFFTKKPKTGNAEEYFIYLRITVNGIATEISTKRKWDPERWNVQAGRAEGKGDPVKSLNAYLDVLQRKVYDVRKELEDRNVELTATNIKALLLGKEIRTHRYMLLEIFKQHNTQMAALVGNEYAKGTLDRYETSYRHTKSFLQWKYKVEDYDIANLNYEFLSEYEFWLKSVRKCGHNPTMKYLSNFRKIINKCIRQGWLKEDPFNGFKLTQREVDREALTESELDAIAALSFPTSRLDLVRDIFLFSCYTGLAYADVRKLKKTDVFIGVDGEKWLTSKRQKTDVPSRVPILPPAQRIISKYNSKDNFQYHDLLLPVLSNQKMNAYLKEIADQ